MKPTRDEPPPTPQAVCAKLGHDWRHIRGRKYVCRRCGFTGRQPVKPDTKKDSA